MSVKNTTDEFSFILDIGEHGIGVFATHAIAKDAFLRLFGDEKEGQHNVRELRRSDIAEPFREYCVDRGEYMIAPNDFGQMPVGWYLNHSREANAYHRDYKWYALRDIAEGEEICIDYNLLEEPPHTRHDYY